MLIFYRAVEEEIHKEIFRELRDSNCFFANARSLKKTTWTHAYRLQDHLTTGTHAYRLLSYRKSGKIRENSEFGVWGVCGAIVSAKKRKEQPKNSVELFRFILDCSNFSISVWENRQPIILMVFGFSDMSMTPKTNHF